MKRQALANGKWFDIETATQWDHQKLYRSRTGKWVLHHWSQW